MSMPERYHPECPPDAHKVIRPPVKEVFATLCVKVEDSEEKNGMANVVEILSLMSKKPLILCSDKMRKLICDYTKDSEVKPEFLKVHEDGKLQSAMRMELLVLLQIFMILQAIL